MSSGPNAMNFHVWPAFGFGRSVANRDRRGRRVEVLFDVVEPQEPARGRHVQRAVPHREAIGLVETAGDHHDTIGLVVAVGSTTACTLPAYCDPTNTVPCGPSAIERAFSTFSANTSARNPAGSTNGASGGGRALTGGDRQAGGEHGRQHNERPGRNSSLDE